MTLATLQVAMYNQFLDMQCINRYIKSEIFEAAFEIATEEERSEATKYINNLQKILLENWTKSIIKKKELYEFYSIWELRRLGQQLCISNWQSLTRGTLIAYIHQRKINDRTNRKHTHPNEGVDIRCRG